MTCPHSIRGNPSSCSQCLGAAARRVEQVADTLVIDGIAVRAIAPPIGPGLKQSSRRGGRRTTPRTKQ